MANRTNMCSQTQKYAREQTHAPTTITSQQTNLQCHARRSLFINCTPLTPFLARVPRVPHTSRHPFSHSTKHHPIAGDQHCSHCIGVNSVRMRSLIQCTHDNESYDYVRHTFRGACLRFSFLQHHTDKLYRLCSVSNC